MGFMISALSRDRFAHLIGANDVTLAAHGARRVIVATMPGTPCRVSLADAEVGESVLLLHYEHQDAPTPYRASHAIFVREDAPDYVAVANVVPPVLATRLLSVRAFDEAGMMVEADVCPGVELAEMVKAMLASPLVAYLHIHNAKPGCYAARVDRA